MNKYTPTLEHLCEIQTELMLIKDSEDPMKKQKLHALSVQISDYREQSED